MLTNVFLKTLRDQRRPLMWWSLGLVSLTGLTLLFWPSFRDSPAFDDLYEQMPEWLAQAFAGEFSEFTSPEGFLNSQLYFFVLPVLFLVYSVSAGSAAIAGEESRGTMGLLLSMPIARSKVVMQKFAAMAVTTSALGLALWLTVVVGGALVDMDIGYWGLTSATLSSVLLGLAFGSIALAIGCARGNRSLSAGATSAFAVGAYFLNALAPLASSVEPLQRLSPFYYYIDANPLSNGLNVVHAAVLAAVAAIALAAAIVSFERRDLRV
jgi:ABC-2 type transport system permease protein